MKWTKRFFVVMFAGGLVLWIAIKSGDIEQMKGLIQASNKGYLLLASLSFLAYLTTEALSFGSILAYFGEKTSLCQRLVYAFTDFFASSISPGGSGGQPAQFFAMEKDGIQAHHVWLSLFAFNMVYHITMLFIAFVSLGLGYTQRLAHMVYPMGYLVAYGILAQFFSVFLMAGLMFSKKWVPQGIEKTANILRKTFLKRWIPNKERMQAYIQGQQECALGLKKRPVIFIKLFLFMLPLFAFYYGGTYFVYRALGYQDFSYMFVFGLQALGMLALESIPLPGGLGIFEISFLHLYERIAPGGGLAMMVLSRGLGFYLGLSIGAVVVAFHFTKDKEGIQYQKGHEKKRV